MCKVKERRTVNKQNVKKQKYRLRDDALQASAEQAQKEKRLKNTKHTPFDGKMAIGDASELAKKI